MYSEVNLKSKSFATKVTECPNCNCEQNARVCPVEILFKQYNILGFKFTRFYFRCHVCDYLLRINVPPFFRNFIMNVYPKNNLKFY